MEPGQVERVSLRPEPPQLQSAAGRAQQNGQKRRPLLLALHTVGGRPGRGENVGQDPGQQPSHGTHRTLANLGEGA